MELERKLIINITILNSIYKMVCEYFGNDLTNLKKRVILLPNPRAGPPFCKCSVSQGRNAVCHVARIVFDNIINDVV